MNIEMREATVRGAAKLGADAAKLGADAAKLGADAASLPMRVLAHLLYGTTSATRSENKYVRQRAYADRSGIDLLGKVFVMWPIRLSVHCVLMIAMLRVAYDFRRDEEMYLSKYIDDTFVENHFDSAHNSFESARRVADIWEWGNNVLWPGLLGNNGPCDSAFNLTLRHPVGSIASGLLAGRDVGECVEGWHDGTGSFHTTGATAYSLAELVAFMDDVDWTDGIEFRVLRVRAFDSGSPECKTPTYGPRCRPSIATSEFPASDDYIEKQPYSFDTSQVGPYAPWTYQTEEELGSTAAISSSYYSAGVKVPAAGYVAIVLPFFSDVFLPEQRGTTAHPDNNKYLEHIVTRENGKTPTHFCVRLSPDGVHVTQLCDPNDPTTGRTTGVVRAACEALWNDLKRGRFIDMQARSMTIGLQLRSNNDGVAARANLLFEISSAGGIMPSYELHTSPVDIKSSVLTWTWTAFALALYFVLFELLELFEIGLVAYLNDVWNVADWCVSPSRTQHRHP